MERICKNCRHYRIVPDLRDKDGNPVESGYCHASRNFSTRRPHESCRRYNYKPELAIKQ